MPGATEKRRILKGIRPAGRLNLGLLHSAVATCLKLQSADDTECLFFCADWHALMMAPEKRDVARARWQMMVDWLAAGMDPERSTLFLQSSVPELAELALLLGLVTPRSWLEAVPTYGQQRRLLAHPDLDTFGLLGYPLLQTADILAYRPTHVPVGPQHVCHVELTNRIVETFAERHAPAFAAVEPIVTASPSVWENAATSIAAGEGEDPTRRKIHALAVDPVRARGERPGRPESCDVFHVHQAYGGPERIQEIASDCRAARLSCRSCKEDLLARLLPAQEAFRERRAAVERRPDDVLDVFERGGRSARSRAAETLAGAREAMNLAEPVRDDRSSVALGP